MASVRSVVARAFPSKAAAHEDHAAGDARDHVKRRSVRTAFQGAGAVVVAAITELTGWSPGPATAIIIGGAAVCVATAAQTLLENLTGRTLPGILGDGIHRRIGDKLEDDPGATPTPWAE